MWQRSLAFVALLTASLMGGCGDSGTTAGTSGNATKVALIVPGSTSDGGWNQLASDSLKKLAADRGIETQIMQQVPKDNAANAIRGFDSKGYALVIAHGFEYLESAKELTSTSNPNAVKTKVAVSGGNLDQPEFQSLLYDLAPASYQLGIIAAKVSKTGKLGFIGGDAIPTVKAMLHGFEAGAKSVNPAATISAAYTGWDSPDKAKRQVEAFIEQGIDVVMQNVDSASSGVFEAVKEYNAKPDTARPVRTVYTFGANSDQNANPTASNYILASAVIKMDVAFAKVLDQVKGGTFKGGLVKEDLANGVSVAELNPKLVGNVIDADTQKLVSDAGKKLTSGEIKLPQ